QDRLAPLGSEGTAFGDLDAIGQRLRQVGKEFDHLLGRLEEMLSRQPAPLVLGDIASRRDAQEGIVGFIVVWGREVSLVGGNDRQRSGVSEVDERGLGLHFVLEAVALELDVEAITEDLLKGL